MSKKRKFEHKTDGREYAFLMLYRQSMTEESADALIKEFWVDFDEKADEKTVEFAEKILKLASSKIELSDALVKKYLKQGWTFDRLGEIEKDVFRTAIPELLEKEAPHYAVINDFVSIAKKYSDDKAASLVNGILDKIRTEYNI